MTTVDSRRLRLLSPGEPGDGPVIYAMSRDQRVEDNWALLYAQQLAVERKQPLIVAYPLAADYPEINKRQADFMKAGLAEVARSLAALNIRFIAHEGPAAPGLSDLARELTAAVLICDFNPLRESRQWKEQLAREIAIPLFEVDAHNIVPVWEASDKQEYAAYTIRPKINRALPEFLQPFPRLKKHPYAFETEKLPAGWSGIEKVLDGKDRGGTSMLFEPGATAAHRQLGLFLSKRLSKYNELRNNPVEPGQSDLSPYFHFGQLSAQRAALEAQRHDADIASLEAFLEELIVRRELADNFCYYNNTYDSFEGFPMWAQQTLHEHRRDPRPYLYDRDTLEAGATHDELWNAAQLEMVISGKMHGYMRMYWAKKILEWTPSPQDALAHAVYLNDKYELDSRDPNGYTGIAWSIGGVHDRAWPEREVFGKIRYMSFGGCKRKFPVADYVAQVASMKTKVAV